MFVLALGLGWLGFFDRQQSFVDLARQLREQFSLLVGHAILGTLALVLLASSIEWLPFAWLQRFRTEILETVAPIFRGLPWRKVALISISAGIGEEFLFRWAIQGGLQEIGWTPAAALMAASLLFGVCHFLSPLYAVYATLAGLILGLQMLLSGSVWPGLVAHALYDFIAILYLARIAPAPAN